MSTPARNTRFEITPRNRVRLKPERGHYDRDVVYRIIDEALLCHVGFADGDQPVVIPTLHARRGDVLYLHGSRGNAMLKHVQAGGPVCVTITLIDGIVFARSAFHHSINYRSVVLFGRGRLIEGETEKMSALEVLTEHVAKGRWRDCRVPTAQELKLTSVIEFRIESASAKIRSGPPIDDENDYGLPYWAGVLPLRQQAQESAADPKLGPGIETPAYVSAYSRTGSG